ncbi:hypothetical protein Glove_401g10 [Diversispora epigaea]|uniref:Uncharacterized protein n=1 Tax=Diversispora epigaea TaxID=1348612 RepID=A0A397H024_9GLOM|nr:hypothetical protein Glove_401g10 [Diversispora epigaea]
MLECNPPGFTCKSSVFNTHVRGVVGGKSLLLGEFAYDKNPIISPPQVLDMYSQNLSDITKIKGIDNEILQYVRNTINKQIEESDQPSEAPSSSSAHSSSSTHSAFDEMCFSVAVHIRELGENIRQSTVKNFYNRNGDCKASTVNEISRWIDGME